MSGFLFLYPPRRHGEKLPYTAGYRGPGHPRVLESETFRNTLIWGKRSVPTNSAELRKCLRLGPRDPLLYKTCFLRNQEFSKGDREIGGDKEIEALRKTFLPASSPISSLSPDPLEKVCRDHAQGVMRSREPPESG